MGKVVERQRRFVAVAEYQRMTSLSYQTVMHMIKTKQINAIQTEGGHYKIDTAAIENTDTADILERLDSQQQLLKTLCLHLGVKT
jgi:hypothetical protein